MLDRGGKVIYVKIEQFRRVVKNVEGHLREERELKTGNIM